MNNQTKATQMLDSIITNTTQLANADKWAYERLNKDDEGKAWQQKESVNYPDKKITGWINTPGMNNLPASLSDKEKANASVISYLEKINNVQK